MRIVANRERCIGAAQCVLSAPEVFEHDDDGIVVVLDPQPHPDLHEDVRTGRALCPSGALTLLED